MMEKTSFQTDLPEYAASDAVSRRTSETLTLPRQSCQHHGASDTPHIDTQLQQPNVRAAILALSAALAKAANEEQCSKCTIESLTKVSATLMTDMRAAKKSGQWSKEYKKAVKKEAKGLFKGMKHDIKNMRKGESRT